MDIQTLDLQDDRLVMEVLAIHCTYPMEWKTDIDSNPGCVPESLAQLHAPHEKIIFVIQDHGRIVAMQWIDAPTRRRGRIRSLWIDPMYRRKGLAQRLILRGEQWFAVKGIRLIEADVESANQAMVRLNESLGFQLVGGKFIKQLNESVAPELG